MINSILVLVQNERKKKSASTSFEELSAKLGVVVLANNLSTGEMEEEEARVQCQPESSDILLE